MKTSQKLLLALCKTVMVFSASIFVISTILLTVVLRPEAIKLWVSESGLYEVSAEEIRNQIQQNFSGAATTSPIVVQALERTITGQRLQDTAEQGIDGTFTWLDGQGSAPQFELNETDIRTTLADQITAGLRQRAERLPACTPQNPPLTSDIFTINCVPPGTDIEQQLAQVRAEITEITEVISTQTRTNPAEEVTPNPNVATTQDIVGQLQGYRQAYQWLKIAPIIATILFIVSGVITFIIIRPKYRILRTLSIVFIPQAILYLIAGWLTPQAVQSSSDAILGQTADTPFAKSVQSITLAVTQAISSSFVRSGLIIGVVGLVLMMTYIIVNNKMNPKPTEQPPSSELNSSTQSSL